MENEVLHNALCFTPENENTASRSAIARSRDGLNIVATEIYLFLKWIGEISIKHKKKWQWLWLLQPNQGLGVD